MAVGFLVRLTPRAGRDSIDGVDDAGRLRVRVAAPPVDGAANEALIRLLAAALEVPRSSLAIESGATSRVKRIRIDGVDGPSVSARWPQLVVIR
jgi:uncharacterized protein (TIGR00251 family)